jgi:hypothetical protein
MADSLTIFLFGSDTPIEVDLQGRSSRDEWKNLRNRKDRWSKAWVEVRAEHNGTAAPGRLGGWARARQSE